MARIQVGGAGGAPSNNFIRSLRESSRRDYLIGTGCIPSDLFLADVEERHVVPPAKDAHYPERLLRLIARAKPEFLHAQNDFEVRAISRLRDAVTAMGARLYLPAAATVETCVDKQKSYAIWSAAGIKVPRTILVHNTDDLRRAFDLLGPKVWIRAIEGGGGQGALPADNFEFARIWIDRFSGWGSFTAAELLTEKSVTWQSLWFEGELVVAQTRRRHGWKYANRALSGVTGLTSVGETWSSPVVDQVAHDAIFAIDRKPHGIFSVDMTYDGSGFPNPTEINIGRFFTTHYFFTKAGLNFPEIYCNIALDSNFPSLTRKVNPLPDGLLWIREMDREPVMTTAEALEQFEKSAS